MSERNYIGGLKKHATRNELVGEAEFWKSRADNLAKRLEEARGLLRGLLLAARFAMDAWDQDEAWLRYEEADKAAHAFLEADE